MVEEMLKLETCLKFVVFSAVTEFWYVFAVADEDDPLENIDDALVVATESERAAGSID